MCPTRLLQLLAAAGIIVCPLQASPTAAGPSSGQAPDRRAPPRLTLEQITALPSLWGTSPSSPVWSPDGRRLAFLWNDRGLPFRDLWVVDAAGGQPRRLTELQPAGPTSAPAAERPNLPVFPLEPLLAEAARRADAGIREAIWARDSRSLVVATADRLYRVAADGGTRPIDLPRGRRTELAFSPDGAFLSWLQDGDLWLWNQKTAAAVRATHIGVPPIGHVPGARYWQNDREFSSYRWSPDGKYVALHHEDRRQVRRLRFPDYVPEEVEVHELRRDYPGDADHIRSLAVYSVADGQLRFADLKGPADRHVRSYSWSPDSSRLLVDRTAEAGETRWIELIGVPSLDIELLLEQQLGVSGAITSDSALWISEWHSDGRGVIFTSDHEGHQRLYSLSLHDGSRKALTGGGWSVVGSAFGAVRLLVSRPRNEIFFVSTSKNPYERQVSRVSESGTAETVVTTLEGTHDPHLSPDGSHLALLHSSDAQPPELYLLELAGAGREQRITRSTPPEFDRHSWVKPRYVTFPSRTDGVMLHGRLLEPSDRTPGRRYPAILGPVYANTVRNEWRPVYSAFEQYLVRERGYVVLQVDTRGSVGYGREFRDAIVRRFGDLDLEDLHSGVEFLETLGHVDPARIGIWGWSYGGLMTTLSLFKKPGVYRAGVAGAPATNVWHATTGEVDLAGRPQTHPEFYSDSSAISFGEQLRDPLLLIHGMLDTIVLFGDSASLAEKLMLLNKDFEFVLLPSSTHDFRRKDYVTAFVLRRIAEFFDRHLGGGR